jgi:hypothetical protein
LSVEAISWVLNEAPDVPPSLVSTLIGIANHSAPDGRNSYPSQPTLARYTRKSERQVRRDLSELVRLKLIRKGDQRIVEHLPPDRRPVVYDLAMDLDGRTSTSARSSTSARTPVTERGDMGDRTGGTPTSAKPSLEPTTEPKNTPPPPADPPKGVATGKGTRLPDDFAVTPRMAEWARTNAPTCGRTDHDAFTDYWRSVPGAKGRKVDWEATWRNWMRREHERRARPGNGRPAKRATADDRIAEIQALKNGHPGRPLNLIQGELA